MAAELLQLVYISKARLANTEADLHEIQSSSLRFNADHDITGLLLHRSGCFLHYLEGEPNAIDSLYNSIKTDPRHQDCRLLVRRSCESRSAPYWSMGVLDLDGADGDIEPTIADICALADDPRLSEDDGRATEMIRKMTAIFVGHAKAA